jgi:putative endonuclease
MIQEGNRLKSNTIYLSGDFWKIVLNNKQTGDWGETIAEEYLKNFGFQVISRNLRTPYGEIDLVVTDNIQIIFVEVKTRTSNKYGFPEEAVTSQKKQHMLQAAQNYIDSNPESENSWRIDVVAILKENGKPPQIEWFKDAI